MILADRDREGVGCVGAVDGAAGQQAGDHHRDLLLGRMAGADDRFLDVVGGIFGDRQAGPRRRQQHDATRQAELQRRPRIAVEEGLLDRRGLGSVVDDDLGQTVI
jgi:hypothetical protein